MNITRRGLLATTTLAPLAACATTPTASDLVTYANAAISGLSNVASLISPFIPDGSVLTQVLSYLTMASSSFSAVASAASALVATPSIKTAIAAVEDVAPIILGIVGLPTGITEVVSALVAILPMVASLVGLSAASSITPTMTPATGLAILQKLSK